MLNKGKCTAQWKEVNDEPEQSVGRSRNWFFIMTQNMQTQSSLVIVHLFRVVSVSRAWRNRFIFQAPTRVFYELLEFHGSRKSTEVCWKENKKNHFVSCLKWWIRRWRLSCKMTEIYVHRCYGTETNRKFAIVARELFSRSFESFLLQNKSNGILRFSS